MTAGPCTGEDTTAVLTATSWCLGTTSSLASKGPPKSATDPPDSPVLRWAVSVPPVENGHTWHWAPYPCIDASVNTTIHDVTLPRGILSDNKEGFPQWIRARMHNGVIEICLFKCHMAFSPVLCIHLWNVCIKRRPIRMTKRKKLQSIAHKIVWRTHSVGVHARHHLKQTMRIPSNTWGPFFVRHLLHLRWFERFQIF